MESTSDEHLGVLPGEDRLVKEVMSPVVVTIDGSASVRDAAEIMRNRGVTALVVCRDQEVTGVLTERDVALSAMHARHPGSLTVQEIMKHDEPITCREDAILADATRAMADHQLQAVPVVDAEGHLVGILLMLDAAGAVMPNVASEWLAKVRKSTVTQVPPLREQQSVADHDQTKQE